MKSAPVRAVFLLGAGAALLALGSCGGGGKGGEGGKGGGDPAVMEAFGLMPEGYRSCVIELSVPHPLDEGRDMKIKAECFSVAGTPLNGTAVLSVDSATEGFGAAESSGTWEHQGSFRNNYLDRLSIECSAGEGYGVVKMGIHGLCISISGRSEDASGGSLELEGIVSAGYLRPQEGTAFDGIAVDLSGRPVRVRYSR